MSFQLGMGLGRQNHALAPHSRSLALRICNFLRNRLGLAIDKVIHHDNVIIAVIVRTWSDVACGDSHAGDPRVVIYDAEERQTSIARRGWGKTAEQELAVSIEKCNQRAGSAVALLFARATPIRLIDVGEDRPEAPYGCWNSSIKSG